MKNETGGIKRLCGIILVIYTLINIGTVLAFMEYERWVQFVIVSLCEVIITYFLIYIIGRYSHKTIEKFERTGKIFKIIQEFSPSLIVVLNEEAEVEYLSKPLAELIGLEEPERAVRLPFLEIIKPPAIKEKFSNILRRQLKRDEEELQIETDGTTRRYILRSILVGKKAARLFEGMDATEIMKAKNTAEETSRDKSRFLAIMSHEVRTPLSAIIGLAETGLQKGNLPAELEISLDMIYRAGHDLVNIIDDILDASKLEAGSIALNPSEYELMDVISDAVCINIGRIGAKSIKFEFVIDENMPSKFYGDYVKLRQALNNLLSNAFKYTAEGSVTLSVVLEETDGGARLIFTIEDTGQGMTQEDQEKLFKDYARFNRTANRGVEGTGLGLSITKMLMDMMGGSISVKIQYGKGSVFTITVKQEIAGRTPIGAEAVKKFMEMDCTRAKTRKYIPLDIVPMPYGTVLVVDDLDTNLYVAKSRLTLYGLKVDTASDGLSAIRKVKSGKVYDVIFMDHMMPGMNGIETVKRIRKLKYAGIIVALTANSLVGNEELFLNSGFDGFLSKLIDPVGLHATLMKYVWDGSKANVQPISNLKITDDGANGEFNTDRKFKRIFCSDALKYTETIRGAIAGGDFKSFTTAVHAMKSALASMGEHVMSAQAQALEIAGRERDMTFIKKTAGLFIEMLNDLTQRLSQPSEDDIGIVEDSEFLSEQLALIKSACEDYDDASAYSAFERLREKKWKKETSAVIENLHDMLYLSSDFEGVADEIKTLSGKSPYFSIT